MRNVSKYGWRPDLPDARDFMAEMPTDAALPPSVDLRPLCPAVYDQGDIGSCTANAICFAYAFDDARQKARQFDPSRLFVYYNERAIEGTVATDSGAQIRDGMKTLVTCGVAPEKEFPYIVSRFARKPSKSAYRDALTHKAAKYSRVIQEAGSIKLAISQGFPVVFGFTVYESFESDEVAKSGIVPMPKSHESVLGGHAVALVGYDDAKELFLVRNSWGDSWGQRGYFQMPYEYVLNRRLASDFWILRATTDR